MPDYQRMHRDDFDSELAYLSSVSASFHRAVNQGAADPLWEEFQGLNISVWAEIVRTVARHLEEVPKSWITKFRSCAEAVFRRRREKRGESSKHCHNALGDRIDIATALVPYRDAAGDVQMKEIPVVTDPPCDGDCENYMKNYKPSQEHIDICLGLVAKIKRPETAEAIIQSKADFPQAVMDALIDKTCER